MLSSILFLVLFTMTILSVESQSNICLWGRSNVNNINNVLNGEYQSTGANHNGLPYWKLTNPSECSGPFYLFNWEHDNKWKIDTTLGGTSWIAWCDSTSNEPTSSCNNKWYTNGAIDTDITTTYGSCPEWDCGIIKTSFNKSSHICGTIFNEYVDTNQWKGYNTLYEQYVYWYFHPSYFTWICNNEYRISCDVYGINSGYEIATNSWTDLSKGSSIDITFDDSIKVQCMAPTQEPTTSNPTTAVPTTSQPTTANPTTSQPTKDTQEQTTTSPTDNTLESNTSEPTTSETTSGQTTSDSNTQSTGSVDSTTTTGKYNAAQCFTIKYVFIGLIIALFF